MLQHSSFLVHQSTLDGGTFFNGDDAVALSYNGVNIDVIGQIGFDPGSSWGGV